MGTEKIGDDLVARINERAGDPDRRTNNSGIHSQAVESVAFNSGYVKPLGKS